MQTHVKVLGVLQLIFGSLAMLLALAVGMGLGLLGSAVGQSGDPDAHVGGAVLGMVGAAASVIIGFGGVLNLTAGIGLLKLKSWGRIVSIVCCALGLIQFPFGTALGVYGLWVLFNKETQALFAPSPLPGV